MVQIDKTQSGEQSSRGPEVAGAMLLWQCVRVALPAYRRRGWCVVVVRSVGRHRVCSSLVDAHRTAIVCAGMMGHVSCHALGSTCISHAAAMGEHAQKRGHTRERQHTRRQRSETHRSRNVPHCATRAHHCDVAAAACAPRSLNTLRDHADLTAGRMSPVAWIIRGATLHAARAATTNRRPHSSRSPPTPRRRRPLAFSLFTHFSPMRRQCRSGSPVQRRSISIKSRREPQLQSTSGTGAACSTAHRLALGLAIGLANALRACSHRFVGIQWIFVRWHLVWMSLREQHLLPADVASPPLCSVDRPMLHAQHFTCFERHDCVKAGGGRSRQFAGT